jgi:hypothetical protein
LLNAYFKPALPEKAIAEPIADCSAPTEAATEKATLKAA